ncbi:uncharacterized protein LOC122025533 [Zingiber officinale]|uniref:uncharacterized protein LOC122025533 n=1 Tax=Zingiber officinale TaxID=94328 RepID=UPI001C4C99D9|nr:uncharacterized protein LOC122025533 [Zingiber officinale]XP_042440279.1 uncharacterized protein LOC122025533 [Zingiber officinale]XP_042440280.1 uncharacterized protein LOC122025533 [Zingiber officinale]XP_042440281.1 uncharacterized protein LOC122025533 [Zingiber officinale]
MDLRRHGASSKLLIASPSVSCGESKNEEGGSVGTEKVAEPDQLDREVDRCYADEDGGDGYRTPTSPSRRIPEPLSCPPAPRKSKPSSSSSSLRLKRRKRSRGTEAEGSGSFASSSPELEDLPPESKKARKMLQWKSVIEEDAAAAAPLFELHK